MNSFYIVKKGDTLYGISNQYGVSVDSILKVNPGINLNSIYIGQKINIPLNSGLNPDTVVFYTVKKGDTLYNISKVYGVSLDIIKKSNNLSTNLLSVGQVLKIPENYVNNGNVVLPVFYSYSVKKGDTLYSIARSNDISVDVLIRDNDLTSSVLSINQILLIRTKENNFAECYGMDFNINSSNNKQEYIVKKGDSLYSIAKKFNTDVSTIIKNNKLTSNLLSIGQKLIV